MCINEKIKNQPGYIWRLCRQLRCDTRNGGCLFYNNLRDLTGNFNDTNALRSLLNENSDDGCLTTERIVRVGNKHKFCPYYACKHVLATDADIIFCSYNYLLDPLIRQKFQLPLQENVVLIDEAHNIEEISRDVNSFTLTESNLIEELNALKLTNVINENKTLSYSRRKLIDLYDRTLTLIFTLGKNMETWQPNSEYCSTKPITGEAIFPLLNSLNIKNEMDIKEYMTCVERISKSASSFIEQNEAPSVASHLRANGTTQEFIYQSTTFSDRKSPQLLSMENVENLICFASNVLKSNKRYRDDFNVVVTKNRVAHHQQQQELSLNVFCLNSKVAFDEIKTASSIILTSGTLSPTASFRSELGLKISPECELEGTHIISSDRMFVRCISTGYSKESVNFSYVNLQNETRRKRTFDDLGVLLLDVCESVPGGILCFIPSYNMLNTILTYFKQGAGHFLTKFDALKKVCVEHQNDDEFKIAINSFYETVNNPSLHGNSCTGALFFAVYGGKLSEGVDFSDNFARAVVCVGIPFDNIRALSTKLKMNYNDTLLKQFRAKTEQNNSEDDETRTILSGFSWLRNRAYRSLNQALGRCLRHSNDWGCLILFDERLKPMKLSKWIRENLTVCDRYENFIESMNQFVGKFSNEAKTSVEANRS